MNQDTYIFLSIALFLLRLFITFYCIQRASHLGRSKIGWGLFGFFLPLVAVIWIQFVKPKRIIHTPIKIPEDSTPEKDVDTMQVLRKSLMDLKEKQLISESEYIDKKRQLDDQEKEKIHKEKSDRIERLVTDKTKPTLKELDQLLQTGILNFEEFNQKKSKLLEDTYDYFKSFPYLNPDCHLQMQVFKKMLLPPRLQKQINEALPSFKTNQIIVYNKLTEKLEKVSIEGFYQLDNSDTRKSYLCIDIFD